MTRTKWWIGLCFSAVAACLPAAASDEYQQVAYEELVNDQVTDLTSRIATLEQQLNTTSANYEAGTYAGGAGGCGCCCDPCCRSQGFVGGVEVGYLKAHHSEGTGFPNLFAAPIGGEPGTINGNLDPDFEAAPRFWAGYRRCDGLGVRARYWEFDHTFEEGLVNGVLGVTAFSSVFHGWDTWVADVEVTDTTQLGCYWVVTVSAGYRHVEYFESAGLVEPTGAITVASTKSFTGEGATAAAEFRRCVSCNLGLYASVRTSVVYGDEFNTSGAAIDPGDNNGVEILVASAIHQNDVKFIYEAQLAAEYLMPLCSGGEFFARAGAEVQYWDTFGVDNGFLALIGQFDDNSVGFAGFFAAVGIER
jgi:hypothetical protein